MFNGKLTNEERFWLRRASVMFNGRLTNEERVWLRNASVRGGGFVSHFAEAVIRADDENLRIIYPAFSALVEKYTEYKVKKGESE